MIRKITIQLIGIIVFIALLQYLFLHCNPFTEWYCAYILSLFQKIRNYLFTAIPFSVGEIVYGFIVILLFIALVKIIKGFKAFFKDKQLLLVHSIRALRFIGIIYLLFLLSWGGSYYRTSIGDRLDMQNVNQNFEWNTEKLIELNNFLVQKINENVVATNTTMSITDINTESVKLFKDQFHNNSSVALLKPSSINVMLSYIGVQGYYHPLTGEGHYNKNVHLSLQPYVFVHEMAHQMGIASETDANFLAYLLCKESNSTFFRYSAYLNIYMYAHSELRRTDTIASQNIHSLLPEITLIHLEEIKQIRIKYRSTFRKYTLNFYDSYLKVFGQEQGLESYGQVSSRVYMWEFISEEKKFNKLYFN